MVETILSISPLQQGTITENGDNQSSTAHVRISENEYVTNNKNFFKGIFDITAAIPEEWEGSPDGDDTLRIPSCPSGNRWDDANYKVIYYHYYISRTTYTSTQGDHLWRVGYIALCIPHLWANKSEELPYVQTYQDVAYQRGWQSSQSAHYTNIDIQGNSITYIDDNNNERTSTLAQFCLGTVLNFDTTTDTFSAIEKGVRDSSERACDVALLGYTSSNALKYSKRWVLADDLTPVDFTDGLGIEKWRFVLKVYNVNTLKTSQIINTHRKFTLQMDSWEMTQDDILINSGMCEEIDSEILVYPFPASFWELDSSDKLEMFMLPESISGDILTYPFPKSFWELDDNDKLEMFMLPEPYEEKHDIIHDDVDGKEYFNQHNGTYNNALKRLNNSYRLRLEILSDEETTIGEITKDLSITAAGQITINYEQITRRSCSLSLINVEKKYIPSKNSPFWLNRKFRLWLGLVVDKDTYWWSQGIFYTVSANATGRILSIEAVDKGGALDGTLKLNMTEAQYQFKRGKALTEMIKQTLALDVGNPYGSKNSPIGFGGNRPIDSQPPLVGIEYYGYKTVADISIDANSYISDFFIKLAELYAADCYYNNNGNLVFEQHIDSTGYTYVPTQWEFTDLSSTYEDVNYEYSYEGENVVTVYTNATQAGLKNVAWTAYNDNPLSPINVSTGIRRASHIEIPYYNYVDEQELAQAETDLKEIQNEIKEKGIDTTVTVYGNIDCNNRQLLVWDETNLERFEEAYESWGYTAEELAGSISTVMGGSNEFDGVEIAYSPILQTVDGAVLLDEDTVNTYISSLISTLPEGWTTEALITSDVTGLTIGTTAIKKLIADAGETAIKTGEAMHYVGKYGALAMAQNEVYLVLNSGQAQQIKDCRSVANHYLLTNSLIGMTLNFNTPIIPHIDVNKTIQVTDQYADIEDGIYLVQSVTIPLSGGKMAISATNINWLPNDMTFSGVSEVIENDSSNTYIGNGGGT